MNRLAIVVLVLVLINGACKQSTPSRLAVAGRSPNLKETRLALVPAGHETGTILFSPYGDNVLYAMRMENDKQIVATAAGKGRPYRAVKDLILSPDGRRSAYVAIEGGKKIAVVDGVEGRRYDDIGAPIFSPDSRLVAYEAKKGEKWHIAAGSRESEGCDMHYGPPFFSADGNTVVFFEQHYHKNRAVVVFAAADLSKTILRKEYDSVSAAAFSPDRSRIGYSVIRNGKQYMITSGFDGSGETESEIPPESIIKFILFCPDDEQASYVIEKDGRSFMVRKGKKEYGFDNILFPPVCSSDGQKVAVVSERDRKTAVFVNGKSGPLFDEIALPVFSPEGSKIAYPARRGENWTMVVNGKEGPLYDMVVSPVFSPDGSRLVYRARQDGKRFAVTAKSDGTLPIKHVPYEAVWQPVFSPDEKMIAYGAKSGQELWWKVEPVE